MFAGFDLGAKLGYAVLSIDGHRVTSGTWKLGKRTPESVSKAHRLISDLVTEHRPPIIGYEKVTFFGRGVQAAHAYGSYEAALWLVCVESESLLEQFTVKQVKKLATGYSNATKEEIEAQVLVRWAYLPEDDNESDALWIAESTRRQFLGRP